MKELFRKFAHKTGEIIGSPITFTCAVCIVAIWAFSGRFFDYSTTWQLFINTMTTIVTFLTVFLIQNTQNRDSRAVHLKLDELIRAQKSARRQLVALEDMSDAELDDLQKQFETIKKHYETILEKRRQKRRNSK
jgi:low affinity Fe/Cu permease